MQLLHDLFGTFLFRLSVRLGSSQASLGSAASSSDTFGPFLSLFTLSFVSLFGGGCNVDVFFTWIAFGKLGFRENSFVHQAGEWP